MELKRHRPGFILAWCAVMAAGAVLLLTCITNEGLWYDEAYTGSLVRQSFSSIIHITGGDNHPPLYYLALRAFTLMLGNTVFTLRLFSVIGALALAALGIGPVQRALGSRAGFIYTVFTLAMPITIAMAQEARMYTWAAFFVTGSALYGYFGYLEGKAKDWALFGLLTAAAAYTHYYALLAVALLGVILLAAMIAGKRRLDPFLYTVAAVTLSYIPWQIKLAGAIGRVKGGYWIPPVTSEVIQKVFTYPFSNKFFIPLIPTLPAIGFLIALIIIGAGIYEQIREEDSGALMAVFAMAVYLLTIVAGIAASWLIRPVLVERYMVPVLGLFILALAYGAAGLDWKLTPSVVAVILILSISGAQIRHTLSNRFNGPMREAVEALDVQPGDIFLHTDEHTIGTFSYYYPDHMNYYYISHGNGGFSNFDAFRPNGVVVRSLDEVPKDHRVWMVYRPDGIDTLSVPIWVRTGKLKVEGSPRAFRLPYSWYGFTVYKAAFAQAGSGAALSGNAAAFNLTGSGGD